MKRLKSANGRPEPVELDVAYPPYPEGIAIDGYYGDGYYGAEAAPPEEERVFYKNILRAVRRHWFLILVLNLLITALAIFYIAQKPNYYTAKARVQVNTEINPALSGESGQSAVFVNSPGADPAYFATQLQILEGSGLMRRVIKTLDLENNQAFVNPERNNRMTAWENVKNMFGLYEPPARKNVSPEEKENTLSLAENLSSDPDKEAERLAPYVGFMQRSLAVSPVTDSRTSAKETRLIDVEYTHQDPVIAAKIANAVSDAYVLQNLEQKVETNASAGDFLKKRVAQLQSQIRTGEERLLNYAKRNQIISLEPDQNTVVQRLTALSGQLGQAENDRIAAQTAYQAAVQNQMWNTTTESRNPQVAALETKLNELRQKLAQLKTEYTDEWYEVVQTKKQIESIEGQIRPLRKRATDTESAALKEKLNEAMARENILRTEFNKQRSDVIRQNEAAVNYKIIQQEIDTNKSLLDGLLQQSKQNEAVISGTRNNVLVLDRAMTPYAPAGPERMRTVLLAFLVSLGLGVGLAFALDSLNDSINYSEDNESLFGLSVLAVIPNAPVGLRRKLLPANLSLIPNGNKMKRYYNLDSFKKPAFRESYLQLVTQLMLSTEGEPPNSILVTSPAEGEGKTLTSLNLAESLAVNRGKVLLIDADLRCPKIHRIKGVSNEAGLTDLLGGVEELTDKAIAATVQEIPEENLHLLTSGTYAENPGSLLSSPRMSELLDKLSGTYAHIVIDSPPGIYFADSLILSAVVDSVVVVVRDDKSSKQMILKIKKALRNVGANIAGIVINGAPAKKSGYYDFVEYTSGEDVEIQNESKELSIT
jgi:polysaccharide biosynthesis transport protein